MTTSGILVLAGPPCAGKSSAGRVLASQPSHSRSVYLEVDAVFSLLLPGSDRSRADRMLAYDASHALARMLVHSGRTAILECTYARHEQRASLVKALADIPRVPMWVVEFFVSPDDAVQRFRKRNEATDLDDESLRERVEGFPYSDQALHLVSSDTTPADLAGRITTWLQTHPSPIDQNLWTESGRAWD